MKVSLYIEKRDFDTFFIWTNRLSSGVLSTCPVVYDNNPDRFETPLQLLLEANEYAMLRDAEQDMKDLRDKVGGDFIFYPEPLENDKILMNGILRNAQRYDLEVDLVNTALELTTYIPGITPLEALIIAEREWLNVGNSNNNIDI